MSAIPQPLRGIFWMVTTGILFVGVTGVVKLSAGRLPAAEAAFLRYALALVFILPMLRPLVAARLTRRDLVVFGLRGVTHAAGVILWFFAMTRIPIADVTAMNYLSPIYITLGAALFLGERLTAVRIGAVAVAFLGALVILRPGFHEISSGHRAMLFTALLFAGSYLMAKSLSGRASAAVVVAMLSLTVPVVLAPVALSQWVQPTWPELGWLLLVAALATAAHYTMTLALAAAPVSVTQPVTFLQLIWATLLGWLAFGEGVDGFVLLGGGIIMGAVVGLGWSEASARRRRGGMAAGPMD